MNIKKFICGYSLPSLNKINEEKTFWLGLAAHLILTMANGFPDYYFFNWNFIQIDVQTSAGFIDNKWIERNSWKG
jgi:hypothetical protein